jgi:spore coat polysaccharide biosynthesis protein SpsF
MAPLAGKPLLQHLLERMASIGGPSRVVLATSIEPENDVLAKLAEGLGVAVYRGDEDDVLGRYLEVARFRNADHLVRVTGDNPLTDLPLLDALCRRHVEAAADYPYVPGEDLLMGILSEVISTRAIEASHRDGESRHRSELVTLYIKENPERFRIERAELPEELYRPEYRLTVDEPEDVKLMEALFARLYRPGRILETIEAIKLLDSEPALAAINARVRASQVNVRSVELDDGTGRIVKDSTRARSAPGRPPAAASQRAEAKRASEERARTERSGSKRGDHQG